jgi:nucleoside phosphorylase
MWVELAPVRMMLDEVHPQLSTRRNQNAYVLGRMGDHNVVVAIMPDTGNNSAATVATQLQNDFPSIRFGLLVGVGGGVPSQGKDGDIRLGDIVVSEPKGDFGGVVQFDRGDQTHGAGFRRTGTLNKPPDVLRSNMELLKATHDSDGSLISQFIAEALQKRPRMQEKYTRPPQQDDTLFAADYAHHSTTDSCEQCDRSRVVQRQPRLNAEPVIHYGTIGSSNKRIMSGDERERVKRELGVICVEMEAAGLMDNFPCLVIRGICDYADSHKSKDWQPYAAMVAAAYMKELLSTIPAGDVLGTLRATESEFMLSS